MQTIRQYEDFYPVGIEFCSPNAMKSHLTIMPEISNDDKVRLAIFDMDGTSINTSSPVRLVKRLSKEKRITPFTTFMLLCWGMAYRYQLPRKNNPVRERVFSGFKGRNWREVNSYLQNFFNDEIECHIRSAAESEMNHLLEQGIVVVMVSASFDSVVATCMTKMPLNYGVATLMKIDEFENYTNVVEEPAPEGPDKRTVFETFANSEFGKDNWVVEYSFGDHLSDRAILEIANHPVAVTPDKELESLAKEKGWEIKIW